MGDLPSLEITRIHRYRDIDRRGSFGPGVFCAYDTCLTLYPTTRTIELWDPQGRYGVDLVDSTGTGQYTDLARQSVQGIALFDANTVQTGIQANARTAVLSTYDGSAYTFEIFATEPGPTSCYSGRLISITDRNANAITIAYQDAANAIAAALSYDRSRLWRMASVTDAYGKSAAFTYIAAYGMWVVQTISLPNATSLVYGYNGDSLIGVTNIAHPDGTTSTFTTAYDAVNQWQLVTFNDAAAEDIHRHNTIALTTNSIPVAAGLVPGTIACAQAPNCIQQVVNGDGEIAYQCWLRQSGPIKSMIVYEGGGAAGQGTVLGFDTYDGIPMQSSRATSFNLAQDPSTYTWESVSTYGTNSLAQPTTETDALGRSTVSSFAPNGTVTSTTQYLANSTTPFSQESANYNAFNEPLTQIDKLGRTTASTYDAAGNLLTQTKAVGAPETSTWTWTYNAQGQPLSATDANGNTTSYVYDENIGDSDYRHLIATIEPMDAPGQAANPVLMYHYDTVGRLATSTDESGRTLTYSYDACNRVSQILYADTSTETFSYGLTSATANLLVAKADRNGNQNAYAYDGSGRMIGATIAPPAGAPILGVKSWTYVDGKPLVASEADNGNLTQYGYDFQLRQVSTTRKPTAGTALTTSIVYDATQRVAYTQDEYGRRTFQAYDDNDMPIRTVKELVPGALAFPNGYDSSSPYLLGISRILTANPPYTIEDTTYDANEEVISRIDGRGFRSLMNYDGQGRLVTTIEGTTNTNVDPSPFQQPLIGTTIENGITYSVFLGYYAPSSAWLRADARYTAYFYDSQGNRVKVIKPRAYSRNVQPYPNAQFWPVLPYSVPFQSPDPSFTLTDSSFSTTYAYTGRNLLASVTEGSGSAEAATVTYGYSPTRKKTSVSDARNPTWTTTFTYYSCCDRLYQAIDPLGMATTYGYDAVGNVVSVRDPNNVGSNTSYDARNRPLSVTNTAGETTTIAYDDNLSDGTGLNIQYQSQIGPLGFGQGAVGAAVAATNPAGETAVEVHDGAGRVVQRIDGNGNASTIAYDTVVANGLVSMAMTDALGHTTTVHADASGKVRESLDAAGNLSSAGFDANGNQVIALDANKVGWTVADDTTAVPGYDAMNRLLVRTDTHGDGVGMAYDANGNVVSTTDALGHSSTSSFDHRDRKTTCTDRVGGTTTYAYDANNHVLTIQDADGSMTTYTYDARNNLATETFPPNAVHASTVRSYTYDPGMRLQSRSVTTSPTISPVLNEQTAYGYDLANRLTSRTYGDGEGNDAFTYDRASRMTGATSGRYSIAVSRSYTGNAEKAGRLTSETVTILGSNSGTYTTGYHYDAANRVCTVTYPSGDTVTKSYTPQNWLNGVNFDGSVVASRLYDDGGRLTSTTLGNGLTEARAYRSDASGVDNYLVSLGIPNVTAFTYAADANKRTTVEQNQQLPTQSQQYSGYDQENRLTQWSRADGSTQTWTLSAVGDWQQTVINGTTQTRTSDPVHETVQVSTASIQPIYDGKGNLTRSLTGSAYAWDSENRLASATVSDTTSGAIDTAAYRYDALGRRIQKTVYRTTTTFIHDGAQVIDEFDAPATRSAATSASNHGDGSGAPPGGGILSEPGSTRIDAQPASSLIPPGFYGDFGQVYSLLNNNLTYGWDSDQSANAVTTGVEIALPQFDSFIQFGTQAPAMFGTWTIGNLTPGTYAVVAVFGDAVSTNQTNDVSIQGISEIDPTPAVPDDAGYAMGNFDGYAETVTVTTTGTITIGALPTAFDPKLCFVEIGPVGSSITPTDRANLASTVASANSATHQTQPIQKKPPSPRIYAYGSYVDEPLMLKAGANKYYYASNHLYSVAALTDSTGAVVERYKYDPYGKRGILSANGAVSYCPSDYGNFVGFTGRYHDQETGLVYFRARMYDVGLGRFIGRDPKMKNEKKYMVPTPMAKNGYQDGMNLYAAYYVPNETDASGKSVTITLSNGTTIVVDTAADLVNALANLPSGVQIIDMTAVGHGNTSAQDQDLTTGSSTSAFQYLWPYGPSLRGPGVEPVPLATLFNNLFAPNATVHLHACLSGATQYNGSHYDNNLAKMISAIFPNVTVYGEAGEYYTFIGTDVQNPFQLFYDLFQNNSVNYYQNGQWIGNLSGPFSAFKLQLQLQTFGSSPQSPYAPGGPLYKFPGGY